MGTFQGRHMKAQQNGISRAKETPEGLCHRINGLLFAFLACISYKAAFGALQTHDKKLFFPWFWRKEFFLLPFHITGWDLRCRQTSLLSEGYMGHPSPRPSPTPQISLFCCVQSNKVACLCQLCSKLFTTEEDVLHKYYFCKGYCHSSEEASV